MVEAGRLERWWYNGESGWRTALGSHQDRVVLQGYCPESEIGAGLEQSDARGAGKGDVWLGPVRKGGQMTAGAGGEKQQARAVADRR